MRTRSTFAAALLAAAAALAGAAQGDPEFTTDFGLEDRKLSPHGENTYFSLVPGHFLRLEGEDDGEEVVVEITVLDRIRRISFGLDGERVRVNARVVEEREWIDGELVEVSLNYFARDTASGSVFYFGEKVDIYKDGRIIGHDGSWLAGRDDALPGMIMPDIFLLGARYFQEIAPDVAMDRARDVDMGLTVETRAGVFQDCVKVIETTPLDPNSQSVKIYAPGVGLIFDDGVELVEYH